MPKSKTKVKVILNLVQWREITDFYKEHTNS